MKIRIGTRGSRLALLQAKTVIRKIKNVRPDVELELVEIKTSGYAGKKMEKAGSFTKEVNLAVADERVDIGVHSLKDLPTDFPENVSLACFPERLTPNDVLICPTGESIDELTEGSIIGTGSERRESELANLRSGLEFREIRGNVETRIEKVENGPYDALVTSMAAVERLGLEEKVSQKFKFEEVVPAAGQGSLGIVKRERDEKNDFLKSIENEKARKESICERAYLRELGLGCQAGAGIIARVKADKIEAISVLHTNGERRLVRIEGKVPSEVGVSAARRVRNAG